MKALKYCSNRGINMKERIKNGRKEANTEESIWKESNGEKNKENRQ